jgi:hypothetical protein
MASSLLDRIAEARGGIKGGYRGVSSVDPAKLKQRLMLVGSIVGLCLAGIVMIWQLSGRGDPRAESEMMTVVDSETNEVVKIKLRLGEKGPFVNPKTTKNTLYPAEKCFWTKDGKAKLNPTYVLLREYLGEAGPTTCPDCGKKVRPRNPMPPMELMDEAAKADRRN